MPEDDDNGENPPSASNIQINEILCWMQNMIHTKFAPTITEICSTKFKVEEIKHAKDILYKAVIIDNRKPEFDKRIRNKQSDTPSYKYAAEIFQLLQEYGPDKNMPKYAAVDLSKLPIIRYDATDISGLLLSHNKLEETVVDLTERIKQSTNIIENLAKNQTVLSDAFKELRDSNTDIYMNNSQNKQTLSNTKNYNITAQENMEDNFECPECDHKCKNEIEKNTHMLSHTEELICSGGDLLPSTDFEMKEHIPSHEVGCKCSECDIRCNDQGDLVEHTTIHSKSFNCHKCKGNFETEIELGEHYLTHLTTSKHTPERTDINETMRPITSKKSFSCTLCDLIYKTESELDSHMREHSTKSARKCKYCTFTTLNDSE